MQTYLGPVSPAVSGDQRCSPLPGRRGGDTHTRGIYGLFLGRWEECPRALLLLALPNCRLFRIILMPEWRVLIPSITTSQLDWAVGSAKGGVGMSAGALLQRGAGPVSQQWLQKPCSPFLTLKSLLLNFQVGRRKGPRTTIPKYPFLTTLAKSKRSLTLREIDQLPSAEAMLF